MDVSTHSLLVLFVFLLIVGAICWGIDQIPGLPQFVKILVWVLVAIVAIIKVAHTFGLGV